MSDMLSDSKIMHKHHVQCVSLKQQMTAWTRGMTQVKLPDMLLKSKVLHKHFMLLSSVERSSAAQDGQSGLLAASIALRQDTTHSLLGSQLKLSERVKPIIVGRPPQVRQATAVVNTWSSS